MPEGTHPKRIGPYRILELKGEGAWGLVYLAEHQEPVRRKVAVKVLKPGLDTHQVLARFEVERQAMAMMNRSIPQRPQVTQAASEPAAEAIQILDILQTTGA